MKSNVYSESLTEVNVLLDVIAIAKQGRYMTVERVDDTNIANVCFY